MPKIPLTDADIQVYRARLRNLSKLGFNSYTDYLVSDLWACIRKRVYEIYGIDCRLCPNPSQVIHHTSYRLEVLAGGDLTKLVPLCHKCHCKIEMTVNGEKKTAQQAHQTYLRLFKPVKNEQKKTLEGRKSLPGYCRICGKKARKGKLLCRICVR